MLLTNNEPDTHECIHQERATGVAPAASDPWINIPRSRICGRGPQPSTDRVRGHPFGSFSVKPLFALTLLGGMLAGLALLVTLLSHLAPFLWQRRFRHWSNSDIMPGVLLLAVVIPLLDGGAEDGERVQVWWAYPVTRLSGKPELAGPGRTPSDFVTLK